MSLIGIGESDSSQDRALQAVERAINYPLLDVEIKEAKGALVNIIGGHDMSLSEYNLFMEEIGSSIGEDAKIISGAQISADMEKSIKVLIILTGVTSSQILGSGTSAILEGNSRLGSELGIDFLEEE